MSLCRQPPLMLYAPAYPAARGFIAVGDISARPHSKDNGNAHLP